ncbi:transglutaminase family protein [Cyanobium sp. ATX-6F1]|uniref:transglutaminase family protein n=1 Tax=Cyanobium sp. ATX-6F1 TaxID=3137388 RepID=UPI0039BE19E0
MLCDTPVEGGSTSRFVDSSLRRFELISSAAFRQRFAVVLNGRPLTLGERPVAVRYRQEQLYPCLHPAIAPHVPLELAVLETGAGSDAALEGYWTLASERDGFRPETPSDGSSPGEGLKAAPWRAANPGDVTVDLRLEPLPA